MKLAINPTNGQIRAPRHATEYIIQNGSAPVDGPSGTLAGIAAHGARLTIVGAGVFLNQGSKAAPRWERARE